MSLPDYVFEEVAPEYVSVAAKFAVDLALGRHRDVPPVKWGRFRDRLFWGVFHAEPTPAIYLAADLGAREAAETALHEYRHSRQAKDPAWGRATREERETDAKEWAREAIIPLRSTWLASLTAPDSLERMHCARPSEPSPLAYLKEEADELRAWRRTMQSRQPRAERFFRGTPPPWECLRARFGTDAVDAEAGTFRGIASVFGSIVDSYPPTIVERGAFTKTLAADAKRIKILYQHLVDQPIGRPVNMTETDLGLEVVGKISATRRGLEVLKLMSDGVLDELSIGFDPVTWTTDANGVRHLEEVRLWEFSVVTFAADPNARVTSLPSA